MKIPRCIVLLCFFRVLHCSRRRQSTQNFVQAKAHRAGIMQQRAREAPETASARPTEIFPASVACLDVFPSLLTTTRRGCYLMKRKSLIQQEFHIKQRGTCPKPVARDERARDAKDAKAERVVMEATAKRSLKRTYPGGQGANLKENKRIQRRNVDGEQNSCAQSTIV